MPKLPRFPIAVSLDFYQPLTYKVMIMVFEPSYHKTPKSMEKITKHEAWKCILHNNTTRNNVHIFNWMDRETWVNWFTHLVRPKRYRHQIFMKEGTDKKCNCNCQSSRICVLDYWNVQMSHSPAVNGSIPRSPKGVYI